jgi:hypothetical protein
MITRSGHPPSIPNTTGKQQARQDRVIRPGLKLLMLG